MDSIISTKDYVMFYEKLAKIKYGSLYERLLRYDDLECFKRLKNRGMFCGMDYVGIDSLRPRDFYSRDDHSRVTAFITLCATGSLKQALAARFHDVGTYPFAHIKSYKERNEAWQDKDEADVATVIFRDSKAIKLLYEDRIDINKISDVSKYPIIDKDRPSLCADRLDGILSAAYIWTKEFDLEVVNDLFDLVVVCHQNKSGNHLISNISRKNYGVELCLSDLFDSSVNVANFLDAINVYSSWQISKESRYASAFLGDILRIMDDNKVIPKDYFYLSESEMIERFIDSPYAYLWNDFTNLSSVRTANIDDDYTLNPKTKIRYSYPLVLLNGSPSDDIMYEDYIRIEEEVNANNGSLYSDISNDAKKLLLSNRKNM